MRGWIVIALGLLVTPVAPAWAEEPAGGGGTGAQPAQASPQEMPPATSAPATPGAARTIERDVPAIRLSSPPVIDGDLSDPVWKEAARADRFVDWLNGNAGIDQTVVSLGYDDKNLYLAWYAYDSKPQEIVARQTKRGAFPAGDDWIDLNLDLFHTHKFDDFCFFYVNPNGSQFARLAGGRATKLEWEGKWKSAARIVHDGYTVEMAIPWEILNYPAGRKPTTIGINFLRFHKRLNMISNWSNIGPNDQHPEYSGHWTGVQVPPFRRQLSLLPYAITGWKNGRGFGLRSGLDVRSRLTPTMTMVGTLNPDFETVEGAIEGIDFSYGPRFVPDRRPFFQEGSDLYGRGGITGRYFDSARIGQFDGGFNVFGKVTQRDMVGALAAVDLGRRSDWILRGRHDLGATSSLDVALYNRDDSAASNRTLLLAEQFRRGPWSLDVDWLSSSLNGGHAGDAGQANIGYQSRHWFGRVTPHFIQPGYRNDLGFTPFTDYKGFDSNLLYFQEWRKGGFRSLVAGVSGNDTRHYDGRRFQQQRNGFLDIQSRSDYELNLGWNGGRFEQFDDSVFNVRLRARASDPFHNFGIGYAWGRRADAAYGFLTPSVTWRFGEKLTLGLSTAILSHIEDAYQHILTFNYDFSPRRGIVGRVVAQNTGTNGYLAYRQGGYGGVETFLILGDPNAEKFRKSVTYKIIWPF